MARTNQGGSILGFLIVGGVLALLLVGGAYFIRQNGASSDGQLQPTSEQTENETSDNNSADEQLGQPEESESAPEVTETEEIPTTGTAEAEGNDELPADVPEQLPTTGIGSVIIGGIMLGSLTGLAIVYWRSCRDLASL